MTPLIDLALTQMRYDPLTGLLTSLATGDPLGSRTRAGYLELRAVGKRSYVHRWAWFMTHGAWPAGRIDHINGDKSDNRLANLRIASASQNSQNMHAVRSRSGFKGVAAYKLARFGAKLTVNGKCIWLGAYRTPEDAARAYDAAATEIYGEFACTNQALGLLHN